MNRHVTLSILLSFVVCHYMAGCHTSRASLTTSTTSAATTYRQTTAANLFTRLSLSDTIFSLLPQPAVTTAAVQADSPACQHYANTRHASPSRQPTPVLIRRTTVTAATQRADTSLTLSDLYRSDTAATVTVRDYPSATYTPTHIYIIVVFVVGFINILLLMIYVGKKIQR